MIGAWGGGRGYDNCVQDFDWKSSKGLNIKMDEQEVKRGLALS